MYGWDMELKKPKNAYSPKTTHVCITTTHHHRIITHHETWIQMLYRENSSVCIYSSTLLHKRVLCHNAIQKVEARVFHFKGFFLWWWWWFWTRRRNGGGVIETLALKSVTPSNVCNERKVSDAVSGMWVRLVGRITLLLLSLWIY